MAYSMNWRPQLDEISESDKPAGPSTTSKLGPIPGLLPPSRSTPHAGGPSSRMNGSSSTQFSSSYSMNWRPKYDDEDDEQAEQSKPLVASSSEVGSASSRARGQILEQQNDGRSFRVSLSEDCPVVECLGSHAFICVNDGVACTLEEGQGVPSMGIPPKWTLHIHPSTATLSYKQTSHLSQAIYCCLYAAILKNEEHAIRLKLLDPSSLGPSAQKAIINLGIPLDLALPITPSFLLQLYQHAEPHLLRPHFPYFPIQSFNGSRKPIAHPARPPPSQSPPELVYSRYDGALKSHCQLLTHTMARGSEWLKVVPSTSQGNPVEQKEDDQSLQLQLSWALEDPALELLATDVSDYDKALHLEGQDKPTWKQALPYLTSICSYAFLTEPRCVCIWACCSSDEEIALLTAKGWTPVPPNTESKAQAKVLFLTQKQFWDNVKSL